MLNKRVVITGLGPVNQLGVGKDNFINGLLNPHAKLLKKIPQDKRLYHNINAQFYVPAVHIDFDYDKRMSFLSQDSSKLAVLASKLAIEDAGLVIHDDNEITSIMGIGIGDYSNQFDSYRHNIFGDRIDKLLAPKSMPNAPSAWISINNNLHGENKVVNAACASGTEAIGEGYRSIRNGYTSTAICGGMEYLKEDSLLVLKSFDELGVLDKNSDGIPRPFQKKHSGFLFNEGSACCLVLEEYEQAINRNATIYAEITGYESSMDAYSVAAIDKSGQFIDKMLNKLIGNNKIDYYNSHGTGTVLNDDVEAKVIKSIFGIDDQPFINSTKGLIGHTFGASGALEAVVCAIAIKYGIVHGNIMDDPLPDLNLVDQLKTNEKIDTALSASFGFGGHNGSLLFERVN